MKGFIDILCKKKHYFLHLSITLIGRQSTNVCKKDCAKHPLKLYIEFVESFLCFICNAVAAASSSLLKAYKFNIKIIVIRFLTQPKASSFISLEGKAWVVFLGPQIFSLVQAPFQPSRNKVASLRPKTTSRTKFAQNNSWLLQLH